MKHLILISIVVFFLLSCNNSAEKSSESDSIKGSKKDSLSNELSYSEEKGQIDLSKIECVPETFSAYQHYSQTLLSPGTFAEHTFLYNSINQNSKILDTLEINTKVNILKEYTDFYLVCTRNGKTGYIKKTDIYLYATSNNSRYDEKGSYTVDEYLIGINKYQRIENKEYGRNVLKIIKLSSNKIIEVFTDSIPAFYFEIKEVNTALKNSKALFYLSYSYYDEIGNEFDHFIIDNGNKLSRLILTSGSGDGGYYDTSVVYLPITLQNGNKIVFAKNGILSIDQTNAKPEIIPCPKDSGVPNDELVIVQNISGEPAEDENGNQKYNEDGTMDDGASIVETIYYRWNGTMLKKVKTIKGK